MLPTDLKLLRALYDQHLFNIFCNLIKELPEVDFNCFLVYISKCYLNLFDSKKSFTDNIFLLFF